MCKDGSYGQDSGFKHHPVKSFGMKDDAPDLITPIG